MKLFLRSADASYFESARLALEAEGIECVYDRRSRGGWTIELVHDDDYDRARLALDSVVVGAGDMPVSRKGWLGILAVLLAMIAGVFFLR